MINPQTPEIISIVFCEYQNAVLFSTRAFRLGLFFLAKFPIIFPILELMKSTRYTRMKKPTPAPNPNNNDTILIHTTQKFINPFIGYYI